MWRNLEAYVDDMVIKSKTQPEMIKDVEETLLTLKKLLPKESKQIQKTKAVVNMPSPSNLKQMQRLSGKLTALNRFLSKAAERSLPCLDTLRKCTNKKDFYWMTEAEEAFQAMKKLIMELPTLTAPKKEEELVVYLSAANKAISAVLLVEREGRQALIHYVSRTLQGAKINYPPMEKLALTLVHAARRLRKYFQGHAIKVITNKPINQILNNREATGILAKWGIELEVYGIKYALRSVIKGQVLADFLADTMAEDSPTQLKTKEPNKILIEGESMEEHEVMVTKAPKNPRTEEDIWKLYTDGASNEHGSGVGLILIDPEGAEYPYSLRLYFTNLKNDAEYEALLACLRIATKMKVKKMHAFVDSKLVVSQISHIPMEENRKADALSKLAAVQCEGLIKGVLVEELNERSVDTAEVSAIIEEATRIWMTPIQEYIKKKILPEDATEARIIREKAHNYTIEEGVLYRKSYLGPLLRCIGPQQAEYLIKEIHMRSCGMHDGPKRAVHKAMNFGYFWPSMNWDSNNEISSCSSCQGMDIVGPLPEALGKTKYLIVAVDYFTKWIESKAVTSKTKKQAEGLGIKLVSTSVYHPQANGAVERANQSIMQGIKTRLHQEGGAWVEELPNVLWAHRTTPETSNGETPFSLAYGTKAVIPAELGIPTRRTIQGSDKENEEALRMNLNLLEEQREITAIREARRKQ
ncbi:reverse transcriptase domain-containing protein [Tanacetum coccineum]